MENNKLYGTLSFKQNLTGKLSNDGEIEGNLGKGVLKVEILLKDHNKLFNRDLENQHPIKAITGLDDELLSIKNSIGNNDLSIKKLNTKIDNKIRTVDAVPINMESGDYIYLIKEEN